MKPYALKYFDTDYLKDADITKIGMYVWTPYSNIKDEFKDEVDSPWGDEDGEEAKVERPNAAYMAFVKCKEKQIHYIV